MLRTGAKRDLVGSFNLSGIPKARCSPLEPMEAAGAVPINAVEPETTVNMIAPIPAGTMLDGVDKGDMALSDATKCLKVDPRNNLQLVTVPPSVDRTGDIDWNASILYWYGMVDRCTQWWRKERRVLFVGDEHVYIGYPNNNLTRCFPIAGIKSILVSHDTRWVNLLMQEEYDLRFCCMEPCTGSSEGKSVQAFLGAVGTIWTAHHRKALPTYRMPASTNFKQLLHLSAGFKFSSKPVVQPPRPRATLFSHLVSSKKMFSVPASGGGGGGPGKPQSLPSAATSARKASSMFDTRLASEATFEMPPSALRPPVSAGRASSEVSQETVIPPSARRPPARAPIFFDSPDAAAFKRERKSDPARYTDVDDGEGGDQGYVVSDASGGHGEEDAAPELAAPAQVAMPGAKPAEDLLPPTALTSPPRGPRISEAPPAVPPTILMPAHEAPAPVEIAPPIAPVEVPAPGAAAAPGAPSPPAKRAFAFPTVNSS